MNIKCVSWQGVVALSLISLATHSIAQEHPKLILTVADVEQIKTQGKNAPVFTHSLNKIRAKMDAELAGAIDVPVPRDAGGGYTHEQHKRNYQSIYYLGVLYQVTDVDAYAERATELLLAYADLYPTLGEHPKKKEQSPGRLFWQNLNESVWLFYVIQGYDAIFTTLSSSERQRIEKDLLRLVADFLSEQSPETFDKIHNHGVWAEAAVGMTGYVLGDDELVQKALYGLDKSGNSGFFKQMDVLFSPDGYYTEGPYYQRYALMPFILFAAAIDNQSPELDIFSYRNEILLKAIYSVIQLSYKKLFFPYNDAIKDKGIDTVELVHGVSIAYGRTKDPALLSIAKQQPSVSLTADGLAVAKGIADKLTQPFPYRSMLLSDGQAGKQGAVAILRSDSAAGHQALVMKNTSQGKGHGHFDKLNWLFYDSGNEIISDYGAARFLNVEAKNGGHYLPENKTWAKQSIAHNTLVVDETSHFGAKLKEAEKYAPQILLFDTQQQIEVVSARMDNAYADLSFIRTMAFVNIPEMEYPLVLDVMRVDSKEKHQYDLPLHYQGHITNVTFPLQTNEKQLQPLGKKNGYQHLWVKAQGNTSSKQLPQVTWINKNRFYTYSTMQSDNQSFIFTLLGAHDPNFNLRHENSLIQRIKEGGVHTFVSILETHGEYNPVAEYTVRSHSQITDIDLVENGDLDYVAFTINKDNKWGIGISYNTNAEARHKISYQGQMREWQGYYKLFKH